MLRMWGSDWPGTVGDGIEDASVLSHLREETIVTLIETPVSLVGVCPEALIPLTFPLVQLMYYACFRPEKPIRQCHRCLHWEAVGLGYRKTASDKRVWRSTAEAAKYHDLYRKSPSKLSCFVLCDLSGFHFVLFFFLYCNFRLIFCSPFVSSKFKHQD